MHTLGLSASGICLKFASWHPVICSHFRQVLQSWRIGIFRYVFWPQRFSRRLFILWLPTLWGTADGCSCSPKYWQAVCPSKNVEERTGCVVFFFPVTVKSHSLSSLEDTTPASLSSFLLLLCDLLSCPFADRGLGYQFALPIGCAFVFPFFLSA